MTVTKLFAIFLILMSANLFASTNDCDGDCSHKNFETKVLPNRKPAVVLQEEIENITQKNEGVSRAPAVVKDECDELQADSSVKQNKDTLKCP